MLIRLPSFAAVLRWMIYPLWACVHLASATAQGLSDEEWQSIQVGPSMYQLNWSDQRRIFDSSSEVLEFAFEQRSSFPVFLIFDDGSKCSRANLRLLALLGAMIEPTEKKVIFAVLPYRRNGDGFFDTAKVFEEQIPLQQLTEEWIDRPVPRILAMHANGYRAYTVMQRLYEDDQMGRLTGDNWYKGTLRIGATLFRTTLGEYGIGIDSSRIQKERREVLHSAYLDELVACSQDFVANLELQTEQEIRELEIEKLELESDIETLERHIEQFGR